MTVMTNEDPADPSAHELKPVYVVWAESGNCIMWTTNKAQAEACAEKHERPMRTLYDQDVVALKDVEIFGLNSSIGHLGSLVDEARELLAEAMRAMKSLHEAATPDESTEDIDATIPGGAFAAFVDAHAALLYKIAHSSMAPTKEA